jgi:hypothetical protein
LAGAEHDRLLVSGASGAMLDGWLSVDLVDVGSGLFLPEIGDEFTIMFSFGGVSGTFLDNPVTQVGSDLYHWDTIYNPHDVRLQLVSISAIPEPSASLLLGFLVGMVSLKRRR